MNNSPRWGTHAASRAAACSARSPTCSVIPAISASRGVRPPSSGWGDISHDAVIHPRPSAGPRFERRLDTGQRTRRGLIVEPRKQISVAAIAVEAKHPVVTDRLPKGLLGPTRQVHHLAVGQQPADVTLPRGAGLQPRHQTADRRGGVLKVVRVEGALVGGLFPSLERQRYNRYMRSENDTWDITTSVGSTALFVAAARALEAQKPDPAAVDPYAQLFCRAVGGQWAELLDGKAPEHQLITELTTDFGTHFVNFQGVRTRYFDSYFTRAAAHGVRQVVILAAGLDSRGYRLAWPDGTTIFELDQPQVLEFKREVLARHGDTPTAQRREIPIDLRDDWPQALRDNGFQSTKPSAWIAEGLLIYLPATAQQQLFTGIDAMAAPGSHVAVEEAAPLAAQHFEAKRAQERAAGTQDGFFSLIYNERFAPAAQWFGDRGWRAEATLLADCLRRAGRPVPAAGSDVSTMTDGISLVSAIKG